MEQHYSSYRWLVLLAFVLTGLLSQLIWITFAPILTVTVQAYGVSEADVGNLSLVFPLIYIIFSIPAGYFIDSYGFRKAVLLGTGLMAVFGLLRAFSPNFTFLLIFQALAAIGQPLIMNSISKLVSGWFPRKQAGLATGIGSLSLYLGIIVALVFTPLLIESFQLYYVLIFYGGFALFVLAVFFFVGKESPNRSLEKESVTFSDFSKVFKNRNILLLSALFFIGMGIFTAFTTWIEPILGAQNVSKETAGLLGGLMIIGGILGSIAIPAFSDKYKTRKKPFVVSFIVSIALWFIVVMLHGPTLVGLALFPLGFFFMTTLPLGLEISAESVEKKFVGAANAVIYLFSQVGALLLIVLFESAANPWSWSSALIISGVLTLTASFLALLIKEKKPEKKINA
jgi:predicted MFS family arabinose efflux permease